MTPAQLKAAELIKKFYKCMPFEDVKLTSCNENAELILEMEILSAGQCAIIHVDGILEYGNLFDEMTAAVTECELEQTYAFWQEVKKELSK